MNKTRIPDPTTGEMVEINKCKNKKCDRWSRHKYCSLCRIDRKFVRWYWIGVLVILVIALFVMLPR